MMMQQKPADQKRVALGVACGLVACAIPFLFKDVQKRELEVSRARDGGGGGGGVRGGFGDGKEEARKERDARKIQEQKEKEAKEIDVQKEKEAQKLLTQIAGVNFSNWDIAIVRNLAIKQLGSA